MRSFTSNSDSRLPRGKYKKLWLTVLALLIIILPIWEIILRNSGDFPVVRSSPGTWSLIRSRVGTHPEKKDIVFLGMSRVQYGISANLINQQYPNYYAVNLAIGGSGLLPTVEHFANDEQFKGVLVCSVTPAYLHPLTEVTQRELLDYYQKYAKNLNMKINQEAEYFLQSHLCMFSVRNTPVRLIGYLYDKVFDRLNGSDKELYVLPDGQMVIKFKNITDKVLCDRLDYDRDGLRNCIYHDFSELEQIIDMRFKPAADKIIARGGRVVLLRMPESGDYWQWSQEQYPEWQCWNYLRDNLDVLPIHFTEYPELADFKCLDGSHLSYEDSMVFTKRLMQIIVSRL
ncbi:MAG: hypothetical protein JXM68_14690 [Sedimentisphaerales bacterium]|nr:hypothetical protein [Sedimentisphaerales bacterium]